MVGKGDNGLSGKQACSAQEWCFLAEQKVCPRIERYLRLLWPTVPALVEFLRDSTADAMESGNLTLDLLPPDTGLSCPVFELSQSAYQMHQALLLLLSYI